MKNRGLAASGGQISADIFQSEFEFLSAARGHALRKTAIEQCVTGQLQFAQLDQKLDRNSLAAPAHPQRWHIP